MEGECSLTYNKVGPTEMKNLATVTGHHCAVQQLSHLLSGGVEVCHLVNRNHKWHVAVEKTTH